MNERRETSNDEALRSAIDHLEDTLNGGSTAYTSLLLSREEIAALLKAVRRA